MPLNPPHLELAKPASRASSIDYMCRSGGVPGHRVPQWPARLRPTKLDRYTAQAIAFSTTDEGVCELVDHHGIEVVNLATDCLAYTPKVLSSQRGQGNLQRLGGALFTYRRHFAPGPQWRLVEFDAEAATLTWACATVAVPRVIDHITRTTALAEVAPQAPGLGDETTQSDAGRWSLRDVHRACDLVNTENSLLRFPDEPATVAWCPADDPIRSLELAFPTAIYGDHRSAASTTPTATLGSSPTAGHIGRC